MGTIGSEAKIAVDRLRDRGLKVGAVRVRVFRPFPKEGIQNLAERSRMLAVIDRQVSYGMEGPLYTEAKASVYEKEDVPLMAGFIAGLGGRDVTFLDIEAIARKSLKYLKAGRVDKDVEWIGLRR
jgi:2-oxoisovalerate ferredoxin oxidoreductase alpha subunit